MSKGKILFGLSGSIACFKSAALISKLVQAGYEVQTVATAAALRFVGEATFEGITGKPVLSEIFARGEYMQHIHLVKWADLTILAPASANTINKLASGIGDDLISTLFLAYDFKKPYLLAPAMNSAMYSHPATQVSLRRLRDWGVKILEPGQGNLACGDIGAGRLCEPEQIFAAVENAFREASLSSPKRASKILITSGGTREAIDGVRTLTNGSTGRTGAAIAETLAKLGHSVTLLRGQESAQIQNSHIVTKSYVSFTDLDELIKQELQGNDYDAVLHLAAVSDYSVDHLEIEGRSVAIRADLKIDSRNEIAIHLKRNFKIVDRLRSYSRNPKIKLIAFKLTKGLSENEVLQKVDGLLSTSKADFVVHNDLDDISVEGHRARIFDSERNLRAETHTKLELAKELEKEISR